MLYYQLSTYEISEELVTIYHNSATIHFILRFHYHYYYFVLITNKLYVIISGDGQIRVSLLSQ